MMRLVGVALAFAAAAVLAHEIPAGTAHRLVFTDFCSGWTAWKVRGDMVITCPGQPRPDGAVELREFYEEGAVLRP